MLKNYMDRFQGCFRRSEQTLHANVYIKGLLSHLERKSVEPIALDYIDNPRGPRNLQNFMKGSKWDDEGAHTTIYQEGLSERLSEDEGWVLSAGGAIWNRSSIPSNPAIENRPHMRSAPSH